jgi:predicted transcriptional regulator
MDITATSLKLPTQLKARIDALARSRGVSTHAFMLQALELHVDDAEKHRQFIDDALAAEREMQRSGKGYALDDARPYLLAKARGKSAPHPKKSSWRK